MQRTKFNRDNPPSVPRRSKPPKGGNGDSKDTYSGAGNSGTAETAAPAPADALDGRIGYPAVRRSSPLARIKTSEEFDELVEEYVAHCMDSGEPITRNGLELWLGFNSHQAFYYQAKRPGFARSVQRACKIVEYAWELRLNGTTPAGAIFALKNMGWRDERGGLAQHAGAGVHANAPALLGSPVDEDAPGMGDGGSPVIDVSALDDDTLEVLMNALSAETVARETANRYTGPVH